METNRLQVISYSRPSQRYQRTIIVFGFGFIAGVAWAIFWFLFFR